MPSPSGRSAACTSRTSKPPSASSRSFSAATAASVCAARLPSFWLALSSTTSATMPGSGSRSSRFSTGLASASTRSAEASARSHAPRTRCQASSAKTTTKRPASAATSGQRQQRIEGEVEPGHRVAASLPEPLKQRRHVHLVGLVVAGQRIHHDVDAGAEGKLALARIGGDRRIEPEPVVVDRPGRGEIVAGDQDRRDAVAAARRTVLRRCGSSERLSTQSSEFAQRPGNSESR